MCVKMHIAIVVNVDGLQLLMEFDAKSKMLLKPMVRATFLKNELVQKAKMLKSYEILNSFEQA